MRWVDALKTWNASHGGMWCVPRKGTKEYDAVKTIMSGGPVEHKEPPKPEVPKDEVKPARRVLKVKKSALAHPKAEPEHVPAENKWEMLAKHLKLGDAKAKKEIEAQIKKKRYTAAETEAQAKKNLANRGILPTPGVSGYTDALTSEIRIIKEERATEAVMERLRHSMDAMKAKRSKKEKK